MANQIFVFGLGNKFSRFKRPIGKTAFQILKILRKNNVLVEIYLADSRKMRFLNKKFRGKDKTANILSFAEPKNFLLPPSKVKKLGEIYINYDVLSKSRSKRQEFPTLDFPLNFLLIHGILHLLGYTHEKKNDRIRMEKAEQSILQKL